MGQRKGLMDSEDRTKLYDRRQNQISLDEIARILVQSALFTDFPSNEAWLSLIARDLGNLWRVCGSLMRRIDALAVRAG